MKSFKVLHNLGSAPTLSVFPPTFPDGRPIVLPDPQHFVRYKFTTVLEFKMCAV